MRHYGKSIEDVKRCVAKVWSVPHDYQPSRQCGRKRGFGKGGLLCKQHANVQDSERGFVSIPEDKQSQP